MIYTAPNTFYLKDEQISKSPSWKDNDDKETETILRHYGCELLQEAGILLKLPQAVMATGHVLFHRLYCKKSLARFKLRGWRQAVSGSLRNSRKVPGKFLLFSMCFTGWIVGANLHLPICWIHFPRMMREWRNNESI